MPETDPFEILRRNDPINSLSLPDSRSDQGERVLRTVLAVAARRRRIFRGLIAAAAAMLLIAAAWVLYREVTWVEGVVCHAAADLDSNRVAERPMNAPSTDLCEDLWSTGVLTNPNIKPGTVPPLTGCVSDEGALLVFPTDDRSVCPRLGLASQPPPAPSAPKAPSVPPPIQLQTQLVDYFSAQDCAQYDTVVDDIRGIMDNLGYASWALAVQESTPAKPCASFSLDPVGETVHVIPIPRSKNQ